MLKNIFKVLISNVVAMVTSFINTLIIPKWLSVNGYAEYQIFILYISYTALLMFGFHAGLFVKYGGVKKADIDKGQLKSEIRIVIWSQIIVSVIVIIIGKVTHNWLLVCSACCILTGNFVSTYQYLYQAWDMFTHFSILSVTRSLGFSSGVLVIGIIKAKLDAQDVIGVYVFIDAILFAVLFVLFLKDMWNIRSRPMISKENIDIFKIGFLLILGGGANLLFSSIDKFFIKGLFGIYEFSMYCFGVTLLHVMNGLIGAIALPMYLRLTLCLDNLNERQYLKEILFCFGALSGCAYYGVAIIVNFFVPHYIESLRIVSILFVIFPAVSIINCMYVNLYKVTKQIKKYLETLILIIVCSILLNVMGVMFYRNYMSIAIATAICYYIWLLYSSHHFEGLELVKKDWIFLGGFFVIYWGLTRISNFFIGFMLYFIVILIWDTVVYKERVQFLIYYIKNRVKTNKIL